MSLDGEASYLDLIRAAHEAGKTQGVYEAGRAQDAYEEAKTRGAYEAGRIHDVYQAGKRDEGAQRDQQWNQIARPATQAVSHDELEERRYGPGGREHYGDPRQGDFPGRGPEALNRQADIEAGQ